MLKSLNSIKKPILHSLFWVGVLGFYIQFFSYKNEDLYYIFQFSTLLMPITILTSYFFGLFLIPRYLLLKKYAKFALYSCYSIIISTNFILLSIFGALMILSNGSFSSLPNFSKSYFVVCASVYFIVLIVSIYYLFKNYLHTENERKKQEQEMLKAQLKLKKQELKYLKMQINPHFLFNTLNSIYGFALQRADETPDLILRLSGLLDYMLYQIDKPEVPISLETEHLANYIELEKIRLEDSLDISHNFDMLNNECMVSPMLFIPFIENAFKHGRKVGNKLKVWIELRVDQKEINFNVKNTYHIQHESSQSGGLGLNNIRQRLKILYPDRHHLIIENNLQEQYFHINLTLQTSKTTSYELSY